MGQGTGSGHGRRPTAYGGRPPGIRSARRAAPPPRRSRSRAHALTAACGAALLLAAPAGPASAAPAGSKERDVQLVYCLADAHRDDLVAAAVRLGLLAPDAVAGRDWVRPEGSVGRMTLQAWAERREADFARACSALMAAASDAPAAAAQGSGGQDDWFVTFLKGLPLLAAGALITLGGQLFERVSSERRSLRQELRSAQAAFRTAAREYLVAYGDDAHADHAAVRSAREALAETLSRVPGPAARRRAAQVTAETLPLADPLPALRDGMVLGTDARGREARGAGEAVDRMPRAVADLNRGLLRWGWRTVRGWRRQDGSGAPGAAV